MERKRRVKTYEIVYVCDTCKKGDVENTGRVRTTTPMTFIHKCNNCGKKYEFVDKCYPHKITVRIIAQNERDWVKET